MRHKVKKRDYTSQNYYKIPRHSDWNYAPNTPNKFKLSRSKIELFLECPKCFYLDNRLGLKRPPSLPFTLNSAVDKLLKSEFDKYRSIEQPILTHPLILQYGIDAFPLAHPKLEDWRNPFIGIEFYHDVYNITLSGGIDDIWKNSQNELIVVDYKSTSSETQIVSLDSEWSIVYKRQLEFYQWLFRKNGHTVSKMGYIVYCNADAQAKEFANRINFDTTIVPHKGNDKWVVDCIELVMDCLNRTDIPAPDPKCHFCTYRDTISQYEANKL